MNTTRNISALTGLTIRIRKAPTTAPIKAPTTGISAVTAIRTPIISAYGSLRIVRVTTKSAPSTSASMHCPVMNDVKFLSSIPMILSSFFLSAGFT